jgi:hypothetical protein
MASTDSTVTIIAKNADGSSYPITVSYYNNLEEVKAEDLLTRQQLQSFKACEHWMKRVGATDAEYMLYCMQRVWTPRK